MISEAISLQTEPQPLSLHHTIEYIYILWIQWKKFYNIAHWSNQMMLRG